MRIENKRMHHKEMEQRPQSVSYQSWKIYLKYWIGSPFQRALFFRGQISGNDHSKETKDFHFTKKIALSFFSILSPCKWNCFPLTFRRISQSPAYKTNHFWSDSKLKLKPEKTRSKMIVTNYLFSHKKLGELHLENWCHWPIHFAVGKIRN